MTPTTAVPPRLLEQLSFFAGLIGSQGQAYKSLLTPDQRTDLRMLHTLGLVHNPDFSHGMAVIQLTNKGREALNGQQEASL